jgi:outer membrane immunogenic protein
MGKYVSFASRSACAFLCLAAAWSPANSADLGYPRGGGYKDYGDPIVVPSNFFSWTGFYLGGNLGYSWGNATTYNLPGVGNGDGFDGGATGFDLTPYGWLGGVSAGYNWHADAFVFGLEGDLGYIGAEDGERSPLAFAETEYGWYGTLTARAGYAQDRFLFYAKGGLALADIHNSAGAVVGGVDDPFDYTSSDEIHAGWALGGGAEYAFNPNMTMKLEYVYMDFGTETSGNGDGDFFEHDNDIHTIKVGVSYFMHTIPNLLE